MTSSQTPAPLIAKITNQLPIIEKILLATLAIGIMLTVMKVDSNLTRFSLLALAVVFFLYIYKPIDIPGQESEAFGFSSLLALMIVPKVLWISSAISALGISLYLFDFGNDGYKQILLIGGLSIAIGTLCLLFFIVSGVKHIRIITPIFFRSIPLLLADIYLLFNW